jgi:hypothetical protein
MIAKLFPQTAAVDESRRSDGGDQHQADGAGSTADASTRCLRKLAATRRRG